MSQPQFSANDKFGDKVYGSFYDFFTGLYSSSFMAKVPSPPFQISSQFEKRSAVPNSEIVANKDALKAQVSPRNHGKQDTVQSKEAFCVDSHLSSAPENQSKRPTRSQTQSHTQSQTQPSSQIPCEEDLIDQHVRYYLRHHRELAAKHTVRRMSAGVYDLDGREVRIEWQYADEPGGQGFLVVTDGPLRQPFSDYMKETDANVEYEAHHSRCSLHMIPKDQRISFNDQHKVYSRLEAMKVAKEQALFREKAACFVKEGMEVPEDLIIKYKKSLQVKLGQPRGRERSGNDGSGRRNLVEHRDQAGSHQPNGQPSQSTAVTQAPAQAKPTTQSPAPTTAPAVHVQVVPVSAAPTQWASYSPPLSAPYRGTGGTNAPSSSSRPPSRSNSVDSRQGGLSAMQPLNGMAPTGVAASTMGTAIPPGVASLGMAPQGAAAAPAGGGNQPCHGNFPGWRSTTPMRQRSLTPMRGRPPSGMPPSNVYTAMPQAQPAVLPSWSPPR